MFKVGDIFDIDNKEYRVRVVNRDMYWLEPVLRRDKDFCVTGGMNKILYLKELIQCKYLNVCY
jgi:hypothetical protein